MKKAMSLLMILGMMGLCVGCGGNVQDGNNNDVSTSQSNSENTNELDGGLKKIGIIQYTEHPSLDTIRESTIARLEELGFIDGENVEIQYQSAQGDQSNLNTIASKFIGEDVDVIIAIATQAAQAVASATSDTPIIFSAVTDPIDAKLVDDLDAPSGNVTGTSDAIPIDQVFELCKELTPGVKTIGFLYSSGESNSQSVIEEAKALTGDYGFTYEESTITSTSELQQVAQSLAGKVDAIYTPIDNAIASSMPILAEVGKQYGIPVYVGADSMVADGGYATVGINYEDLGAKTGDMVAEVLEGTSISEIPVETLDQFYKVINKTVADIIGAPVEVEGAIIVE